MTEARFQPPSALRISLLGPFDVQIDGNPMGRVRSRKEHWLLALLVLRHGREVSREWLAETLWPDSRIDQSRSYLRLSLCLLKKALRSEGARLNSTVHSLRLDLTGADVDVIAFDAAIARGDAASLQAAMALYRGSFLEGCAEPWAANEQRVREQSWLLALEQLAESEVAQGRRREGRALWMRLIQHDPLRESAHRALMQALAEDGDFAAMTTVYRDLRILLRQEVNADPSPESVLLYEQLRARSQRPPEPKSTLKPAQASPLETPLRREEGISPPEMEPRFTSPLSGNLPATSLPRPLTPLIGRLEVVQEIAARLETARLVTLIGAGGVGKTRLALRVAQGWLQKGEVSFVELAALTNPSLLVQTVATACQLVEEPEVTLADTLIRYLSDRPNLLLILDNCEHLLEACAGLAVRLLHSCPELRILATSRQALSVSGESLFPAPMLEMPPGNAAPEKEPEAQALARLRGYEAIRLFEDRAQAVTPAFRLTAQNATAVLDICRHLDGIPLAIELAAAWISVLTPEQMLARLTESRFDLLVSRRRDPEERHRSLWTTLDSSSQLLEPELRQFLACLSVFRGGWTLEAAEAVCLPALPEASLPRKRGRALEYLALLQERSLVQTASSNGTMRYSLLESVREYASDLLTTPEREALSQSHAAYFLELAEEGAPHLIGHEQVHWLDRLEEELYNLRAALAWCAQNGAGTEMGLRLSTALGCFWDVRGHHQEGIEWIFRFLSQEETTVTTLHTRAREALGILYYGISELETCCRWSLEALKSYTALGESMGIARAHCTVGISETNLNRIESARTHFHACLAILERGDDSYEWGRALGGLGMLEQYLRIFDAARPLLQQSADRYRICGHLRGVALTLYRLGGIALVHRQFDTAQSHFMEALALTRAVKDRRTLPFGLFHLGRSSFLQNDFANAKVYLREAVSCSRANHNNVLEGTCLLLLGDIAMQERETATACAFYLDALTPYYRPETARAVAIVGSRLAPLALRQNRATDALRLYAYGARYQPPTRQQDFPQAFLLYMSLGYILIDQDPFDADLATLRQLLPDEFEPIRQEAQTMSPAEGVVYIRRLSQQLA